jgi:N-methylhydantoinase A
MRLDLKAAETAVTSIAEPLGLELTSAAGGVIRLAETNMVYAIRQMTVERGQDPRQFALLAYGGGGGLFASTLIEELEIPQAIVPANSAVFSAWGLLFADYREDAWLTKVLAVNEATQSDFAQLVERLVDEAREKLALHGIDAGRATVSARADVRFVGQEHTLIAPIKIGLPPARLAEELKQAFAERHRAQYGQADIDRDIEVVTVRATAVGGVAHPELKLRQEHPSEASPRTVRPVWFTSESGMVETSIWSRADLEPGALVHGPALLEEWNATTLVNPGQLARIDGFHSARISPTSEAAA